MGTGELGELHRSVRAAIRARGLRPSVEHRFVQRDGRVWVETRADGLRVAGTLRGDNVVIEMVDGAGRSRGAL